MIECIFTLDYEIYGNGEGCLKDLVYEPAQKLMALFRKWQARFVAFVEVAELEILGTSGTDPASDLVGQQVRELYQDGFEIGLHLHPQWYNAHHYCGSWALDYSEYNLCTLSKARIVNIVDRALAYLRSLVGVLDFTPFSFRAGNWLFQPTPTLATTLAERGIKVDSSVFKGGLQRHHNLDYRRALKNNYFWFFSDQVDVPDASGALLELPIWTQMVPFWKMATAKRIGIQRKGGFKGGNGKTAQRCIRDFLRLQHPLKLDFCRMATDELIRMVDNILEEDRQAPTLYKPVVAIGHTKDLLDLATVENFLLYLKLNRVPVSTFREMHRIPAVNG